MRVDVFIIELGLGIARIEQIDRTMGRRVLRPQLDRIKLWNVGFISGQRRRGCRLGSRGWRRGGRMPGGIGLFFRDGDARAIPRPTTPTTVRR